MLTILEAAYSREEKMRARPAQAMRLWTLRAMRSSSSSMQIKATDTPCSVTR